MASWMEMDADSDSEQGWTCEEMDAEQGKQREMELGVKETASSETLAAGCQSLAENDGAETDKTPNKCTQPDIASSKTTNNDDTGAGECASTIEEQDDVAKKAARQAGRIARTAKAAIQAKKQQTEIGRRAASRRVTFDVRHARLIDGVEQDKGYIFFESGVKRYGGPFAFLSNFYPSEFRVEEVSETHTFVTMEQFYQYCKATAFCLAPEVFVIHTEGFEPLSSHEVAGVVLVMTSALLAGEFVRNFMSCATKQHPGWSKPWEKCWASAVPKFLEQGLHAKFADNEDLMDLLQKTGNYELVKASPNDKKLGIGFAADVAFDHRDE
jgi:predicted NAD-dependent protein-ADP-ribosyltransferase YbiA (DUF1768 family)